MAKTKYIKKNVRNVVPEIRGAVVEQALADGCTISDVVGGILAQRWGLSYESSGEKSVGAEIQATQFLLKMPPALAARINKISRASGMTESSVVQNELAEHYLIPFTPRRKGRKPREQAAA
jgi:hypothetical protein